MASDAQYESGTHSHGPSYGEADAERAHQSKQWTFAPEASDAATDDDTAPAMFSCHDHGCNVSFFSSTNYDSHVKSQHMGMCSVCKGVFQNTRLVKWQCCGLCRCCLTE